MFVYICQCLCTSINIVYIVLTDNSDVIGLADVTISLEIEK